MADVKWIKIVTDIFDDDKILLIESMPEADAIIVIWFKLLCLAGKQNNSGVFLLNGRIAYTEEMFATIFRRPLNTVRLALRTFEQFGMIEIINDTITIPNWEKHQKLDALEASREATRKRVARYREKQKQLASGSNVTVTDGNADRIDKNRLDKNREDKNNHPYYEGEDPMNPYGEGNDRPSKDTVFAYASSNLVSLSHRAMEEIVSFVEDLSEDVVRHAIDNALDNGVRTWAYVKSILNRYMDDGVKNLADAKAADDKRKKEQAAANGAPKEKTWGEMTEAEQNRALNSGPFGRFY